MANMRDIICGRRNIGIDRQLKSYSGINYSQS